MTVESALKPRAVVIGASAGAVAALSAILPALPADYPLPILVVVHLPADGRSLFAEIFRAKCRVQVAEAEDKEPIRPGTVYFAPPDYHLLVEKNNTLALSSEEPVLFSRPSIDVLFESAADAFGPGATGVVLTGANEDGAEGLRKIVDAGGAAVVLAPSEAHSSAMPIAAIAACPTALVMDLDAISRHLVGLGGAE